MPHAILTLSVLPSAWPIKLLVPLKSSLPPLTLVIGNENKVEGFPNPQTTEVNSLLRSVAAVGRIKPLMCG